MLEITQEARPASKSPFWMIFAGLVAARGRFGHG